MGRNKSITVIQSHLLNVICNLSCRMRILTLKMKGMKVMMVTMEMMRMRKS